VDSDDVTTGAQAVMTTTTTTITEWLSWQRVVMTTIINLI